MGWNSSHKRKFLPCVIIPGKPISGFCPRWLYVQCQACPPISRPPPSETKSWISSIWSSLYPLHTNTLRSFLNCVFSHFNPELLVRWSFGATPTTPFRLWSNQSMALFQNEASVCYKRSYSLVNHVKWFDRTICNAIQHAAETSYKISLKKWHDILYFISRQSTWADFHYMIKFSSEDRFLLV